MKGQEQDTMGRADKWPSATYKSATGGQPPPAPTFRPARQSDTPFRRPRPTTARPGAARSSVEVRMPHLPGLDGLRAFAVIGVLLYHAGVSWLPGGFLGVEVFFVISGYLITALLLSEWKRTGRLDLKTFWLRRARRLLPALFLLLAVSFSYAVLFLPGEVAGLRNDVLAALGYVTNWYYIFGHTSYFQTVGRPSLLQHLWSLAVEEQFYLLWPILLGLGLTRLRRYRLLTAILAGAAVSTGLMALLYQPDADPSRLYYGTDTRAAGLLIGAALAFVWTPWRREAWQGRKSGDVSIVLNLVGGAALGLLVWFGLNIGEYDAFLYRGGFALVALTTAVLIAVVVHPLAHLGPALLDIPPVRWFGLRSYGLYLWHWPVLTVTRPELDVNLDGWPLLVVRLGLTVGLAELSYRFVEAPVRAGRLGRAWQRLGQARGVHRNRLTMKWAGTTALGVAFLTLLGLAATVAQPPAPPSYLAAGAGTPVGLAAGPKQDQPKVTAQTPATAASSAPTQGAQILAPTPTSAPQTQPATVRPTLPVVPKTKATLPVASLPTTAAPASALVPGSSLAGPTPPSASKGGPGWITAVGDSVMLGAVGEIKQSLGGVDVEAAVGMQAPAALNILRSLRSSKQLGEIVVIHLGTNGIFSAAQFDEMMSLLKEAGVKSVVFVNVKVPRYWESSINKMLTEGVQRYPGTVLLDWHAVSSTRPDLFWEDGIHLRPKGAEVYTALLAERLKTIRDK